MGSLMLFELAQHEIVLFAETLGDRLRFLVFTELLVLMRSAQYAAA
jgi:hypothetical protein